MYAKTSKPIEICQIEMLKKARAELRDRIEQNVRAKASYETCQTRNTRPRNEVNPRSLRSLRSCHRYAAPEIPDYVPPEDTGAFIPSASANIENDRALTDGARRCARKILEETYRRDRAGRRLKITVSYLAAGLGRSRRTIQRYLRQLESCGYITVEVLTGQVSRLCVGLRIRILGRMLPKHHREKWPEKPGKPGATSLSQKQSHKFTEGKEKAAVPVPVWAARCMDGVWRAFIATDPLRDAKPFENAYGAETLVPPALRADPGVMDRQ